MIATIFFTCSSTFETVGLFYWSCKYLIDVLFSFSYLLQRIHTFSDIYSIHRLPFLWICLYLLLTLQLSLAQRKFFLYFQVSVFHRSMRCKFLFQPLAFLLNLCMCLYLFICLFQGWGLNVNYPMCNKLSMVFFLCLFLVFIEVR